MKYINKSKFYQIFSAIELQNMTLLLNFLPKNSAINYNLFFRIDVWNHFTAQWIAKSSVNKMIFFLG